jgi:hypothetical protein
MACGREIKAGLPSRMFQKGTNEPSDAISRGVPGIVFMEYLRR